MQASYNKRSTTGTSSLVDIAARTTLLASVELTLERLLCLTSHARKREIETDEGIQATKQRLKSYLGVH